MLRPMVLVASSRSSLLLAALLCAGLGLARAQEGPALEIAEPAEGAVISGPDVTVRVRVRGVEFSDSHFLLLRLDTLPPVKSFAERFTFRGVRPGTHVVTVELRHSDGRAYDPPVSTRVRFHVRAEGGR